MGIIADTMGRPLRDGVVGASGLVPPRELAGLVDPTNCELATTMVAIDEIASDADLVVGKLGRAPAALVAGSK